MYLFTGKRTSIINKDMYYLQTKLGFNVIGVYKIAPVEKVVAVSNFCQVEKESNGWEP